MHSIKWLRPSLTAILLLLCGCGGGSSPSPAVKPPSALSYTASTAVYTTQVTINLNGPTSTGGAVATYSVSPALPAGLTLSTTSGMISGMPTTIVATANYIVTASNSAGSTTASLSITVNDAAPAALVYAPDAAVYSVGTPIAASSPANTGGTVTLYSVVPTLPAGLSLSPSSGIISGTPTHATPVANYTVTASNTGGSTTATLAITVNVAPLSANDINLIFVVSEDLAYQAPGDISPSTANLTPQGLKRSLLMAPYLQNIVLGGNNVTGIYALEPMTHMQITTTGTYPDMVAIETIQQFAQLNQISLPADRGELIQFIGNSFPVNISYGFGFTPTSEIAAPLLFCYACQGLDFNDQNGPNGDNESVLKGIIEADAPGFYVLSAPWETTSSMLANINLDKDYNLTLPAAYQGPNYIYAISIPPSGSTKLVTYNTNLNPSPSYPVLPSPGVVRTSCTAQTPFRIPATGSIPPPSNGFNTNETVYFVRHAEAHPMNAWDDGNFVAAGQWRALDLPNALQGKISPTQVYSIDPAQVIPYGHSYFPYVRPSLTVEAYVIANNLPLNLIADIEIFAPNSPQQTSDFFFKCCAFSGETVLLAWEHDHFPLTVDALLKSYGSTLTSPGWPGNDYDTIWTVTLDANSNLTVDNSICEGINSAKLPAVAPQF